MASLVVLIAACTPAPAERLHTPTTRARPRVTAPVTAPPPASPAPPPSPVAPAPPQRVRIAAPRPRLALKLALVASGDPTDVAHLQRWPLTASHHPALEPAYAIAAAFAEPGVSWTDLCRMGAQNRVSKVSRDQLEYLRAWCDVERHDAEAAVTRLAPLLRSSVAGVAAAARSDIANIVVDSGDAEAAQRTLAKAQIHELAMLDLIAASYLDIGKPDEASVFNDAAIASYAIQKPGEHCHRLARRAILLPAAERRSGIRQLERYADRTCGQLMNELTCWDTGSCDDYFVDHGVDPKDARLAQVYNRWPTEPTSTVGWYMLASSALKLLDTPGADLLAVTALEAVVRSTRCLESVRVGDDANKIKRAKHDASLDARLEVLISDQEQLCNP
ncbi:MAG: hypothetical protein IPQ07_30565 [Myxococcales bacterium]|nr:hypothetical protein [Myxococcales bacterium]